LQRKELCGALVNVLGDVARDIHWERGGDAGRDKQSNSKLDVICINEE
jgi:hypothetical protein